MSPAFSGLHYVNYNPGLTSVQDLDIVRVAGPSDSSEFGVLEDNMEGLVFISGNLWAAGRQTHKIYTVSLTDGQATEQFEIPTTIRQQGVYRLAHGDQHFVLSTNTTTLHQTAYYWIDAAAETFTHITTTSDTRPASFTFSQGRFWGISEDYSTLRWFTLTGAGALDQQGDITLASLGITIDTTNFGYGGMCNIGQNIIIFGENTSENMRLFKMTGQDADNRVILPANYRDIAIWMGEVRSSTGALRPFMIPSAYLRQDVTFTENGHDFEFTLSTRELRLTTATDTFINGVHPLLLAKA